MDAIKVRIEVCVAVGYFESLAGKPDGVAVQTRCNGKRDAIWTADY